MPKTTKLDRAKFQEREVAERDLERRGSPQNENSVPQLAERLALLEQIIGLRRRP